MVDSHVHDQMSLSFHHYSYACFDYNRLKTDRFSLKITTFCLFTSNEQANKNKYTLYQLITLIHFS